MATIFSKIIQGEIPSYKIAEDENYFAFLDIMPVIKGHALVIPKVEVDYIYDIEDDTLAGMHLFAKKVASAIHKATECQRISVLVAGFEVPHAHIHLIPSNTMDDLSFANKYKASQEELAEMQEKIISFL